MNGRIWNPVRWIRRLGIILLLYLSLIPAGISCSFLWSYSITSISALSVSDDGNFIAVGCHDGFYYVFDMWGILVRGGTIPTAITSLDIANNGEFIIGCATGYIFYGENGVQSSQFVSSPVRSVSISSDGTSSLVCCQGNLFINQGNAMVYQLEVPSDFPVGAMSSDSSSAYAASGTLIHVFENGDYIGSKELNENVENLFVSADGKRATFFTDLGKVGYIDIYGELQFRDMGANIVSMVCKGDTILLSTVSSLIWIKNGSIVNESSIEELVHCLSLSEDGFLAVIEKGDSTIQLITVDGECLFTYDFNHIISSEISRNRLIVCTDDSIYVFQLFQNTRNNERFNPLPSRKSLPLTSSLDELWSILISEDAEFFTADVDGDGFTEIVLKEGTKLYLLNRNGIKESERNLGIPFSLVSPFDIDNDTIPEISFLFEESMFLFSTYDWSESFTRDYYFDSTGHDLSQRGTTIPFAVLDSDGDGKTEILAVASAGYSCKPRGIGLIDSSSGETEWFYQTGPKVHPGVVADINGDGQTEIILGSGAPCNCPRDEDFPDCGIDVIALSSTGEELWKVHLGEGFRRVAVCAEDLDPHEGMEIIGFGYEASQKWGGLFVLTCSGELLYTYEADYSIFPGAVCDIDADGSKEIIAADSRGHITIRAPCLDVRKEEFISKDISSGPTFCVNDLNGDGSCEILLAFGKKLLILDKDLKVSWEKEFPKKINFSVINFSGCKNTLLILSDKLYAYSYKNPDDTSCPLWVITERSLREEAQNYMDRGEFFLSSRKFRDSKKYFESVLAIFSQLEDEKMIEFISKKIAQISDEIFKEDVMISTFSLMIFDFSLCVFLLYFWITRKRWVRLAEGTLLLSSPVLLGLFQVYYSRSDYILVFVRYFVPSLIFCTAIFLRQNILGAMKALLSILSGHKDMLVLSITKKSDESYLVSVESVKGRLEPVKELHEIPFTPKTRKEVNTRTKMYMETLIAFSTRNPTRHLDRAQKVLKETGETIYHSFIPKGFSEILKARFLLLEVEDTETPWEFMHSDDFFALKYGISRRIVTTEVVDVRPRSRKGRRALVISDPSGDLPNAKTESEIVCRNLRKEMEVISVEGSDASIQKVANLFGQGFDIIHYAGHIEHGLVLFRGTMSPQEVRDFIAGTPIVFVNGCRSEELAKAFLLGGAMGYLGTVHPIHDYWAATFAADFYRLCLRFPIGEALRRARKEHKDKSIIWASLMMYGDPTSRLL